MIILITPSIIRKMPADDIPLLPSTTDHNKINRASPLVTATKASKDDQGKALGNCCLDKTPMANVLLNSSLHAT